MIFHTYAATPPMGVIADIITHAKFFVYRFRCLGFLTAQNFAISIGLAGQYYNSVSTTVLHCELAKRAELCQHIHTITQLLLGLTCSTNYKFCHVFNYCWIMNYDIIVQ